MNRNESIIHDKGSENCDVAKTVSVAIEKLKKKILEILIGTSTRKRKNVYCSIFNIYQHFG